MGHSREFACFDVLDPCIRHDTLSADAEPRSSINELEHCYLRWSLTLFGILLLRRRQSQIRRADRVDQAG